MGSSDRPEGRNTPSSGVVFVRLGGEKSGFGAAAALDGLRAEEPKIPPWIAGSAAADAPMSRLGLRKAGGAFAEPAVLLRCRNEGMAGSLGFGRGLVASVALLPSFGALYGSIPYAPPTLFEASLGLREKASRSEPGGLDLLLLLVLELKTEPSELLESVGECDAAIPGNCFCMSGMTGTGGAPINRASVRERFRVA